MKIDETLPIKFFISKSSSSYDEDLSHFKSLLNDLKEIMPVSGKVYVPKAEIYFIEDHPEVAEEYNISGLPLLIVHNHQFLGVSDLSAIVNILKTHEVRP